MKHETQLFTTKNYRSFLGTKVGKLPAKETFKFRILVVFSLLGLIVINIQVFLLLT